MGQVEDGCICQVFTFTFQQPGYPLRVWGHRFPIGQKCSDSAVFITIFMSPQEILKENLRMFELVQKHPSHWPPFIPPAKPEVTTTGAGKLLFTGSPDSRPMHSSFLWDRSNCGSCFLWNIKFLLSWINEGMVLLIIVILWCTDIYPFQRAAENELSAKVPHKIKRTRIFFIVWFRVTNQR